jgi:hypothetical protein
MGARYGPLTDQVIDLILATDHMTAEQMHAVAEAYNRWGRPVASFSEVAAKKAGRWAEVHLARKDMALTVVALGLTMSAEWDDVRLATHAAGNAGLALATEDLIGTMGYTSREYGRLVGPWFDGA